MSRASVHQAKKSCCRRTLQARIAAESRLCPLGYLCPLGCSYKSRRQLRVSVAYRLPPSRYGARYRAPGSSRGTGVCLVLRPGTAIPDFHRRLSQENPQHARLAAGGVSRGKPVRDAGNCVEPISKYASCKSMQCPMSCSAIMCCYEYASAQQVYFVIASKAKQSPTMKSISWRLLRHFVPR